MDSLKEKHLHTGRGFNYRYYTSSGSTSKTTLLLCHGFPDDARLYQYMIPHLQKSNLRLIIPDLLGAGGTSKPVNPTPFEIKAMVQGILDILRAENISKDIIPLGHDWGAYFAQRFYMLNPSLCLGLITLSVALSAPFSETFDLDAENKSTEQTVGYPQYAYWELFLPPSGVELMDQRLESMWHIMHGDEDEWMKKMFCSGGSMRAFLSADPRDVRLKPYAQNPELKNSWIQTKKSTGGFMSPTCWYRAVAFNHQQATEKTLDPKVDKPYLFIGCDGDAVCRTDAIEVAKKEGWVRDLTVREVESGHWCPYEKPEEVAGIVVEWLRGKGFSGA